MTYEAWHRHFQRNLIHFDHIDWLAPDNLEEHEKKTIAASIAQFQRGENSEGKNLIRFAKQSSLPHYYETIIVFIKEEQRHAAVLGKFMKQHGIPKIREHWVDGVFRKLRTLADLENSVLVLITAEIIAAVYYKGLLKATNSRILRSICKQILIDEGHHINFQSSTLHHFFQQKNRFEKLITRWLHWVLMFGTTLVVWTYHGKVLKAGGYGLRQFYKAVFEEYRRSEKIIKVGAEKPEEAAVAEKAEVPEVAEKRYTVGWSSLR